MKKIVRIKYGLTLDSAQRKIAEAAHDSLYPSRKEVGDKTKEWITLWNTLNNKHSILDLISETVGTSLTTDLEIHIIGGGLNPMSSPLLIPVLRKDKIRTDNEFIEGVIHELTHRFVGDYEYNPGIKEYWQSMDDQWQQLPMHTRSHIIVYAVVEVIISKIFGKERLSEFIHPDDKEYQYALDIVKEKGAQNLINEFRSYLK